MALAEVMCKILRETLLKKGSPSNSLPKTFSFKFPPDRTHANKKAHVVIHGCVLSGGNFRLKVFGKGFGEEPFLRKVFPEYLTYYSRQSHNA